MNTRGAAGEVSIPRRVMTVFLASFFLLAYVITPYWSLVHPAPQAAAVLIAELAIGGIWCYFCAGSMKLSVRSMPWIQAGIVLAGMLLLNLRTLTSVIPWRGDESWYISQTQTLTERIAPEFILAAAILFSFVVFSVTRKSPWLTFIGILASIATVVLFFQRDPFQNLDSIYLLGHPFVSFWLYAIVPMAAKLLWDPNHEFLYRIIPLLSATAIVWIFIRNLPRAGLAVRLLWGLAIATIPVLIYYSSILYLELPAVVLMVLVCLHAENLLTNDLSTLKEDPAWYALLLLGFIKETVFVFLLCFLACRVFFSWCKQTSGSNKTPKDGFSRFLIQELLIAFCVLLPYFLYMIFRVLLLDGRTFNARFSNLLDPLVYKIIALSFIEQFGGFLFLFLGGMLMLIRKKHYPTATFTLLLFFLVPLFFSTDTKAYTGYSRFNLFVFPSIFIGSFSLISQISKWGRAASGALALVAIAVNLAITPINLDGSKVPYWGNALSDTSEHYYPYDQAFLWIKENTEGRFLMSGMYYRYLPNFYFAKFKWIRGYEIRLTPPSGDETKSLADTLSAAEQEGFKLVLFQNRWKNLLKVDGNTGFCLLKVFANQAHELELFAKGPACRILPP